jgi:hypothetical protein
METFTEYKMSDTDARKLATELLLEAVKKDEKGIIFKHHMAAENLANGLAIAYFRLCRALVTGEPQGEQRGQ